MKNGIEIAALSLEPYSWMHAHRIWSVQMPRVARELHVHDLLLEQPKCFNVRWCI